MNIYVYLYYIYLKWPLSCPVLVAIGGQTASDRHQIWHKYSLGLRDEDMGVGERVASAVQPPRTSTRRENECEAREYTGTNGL
jgi:hypothetical protein